MSRELSDAERKLLCMAWDQAKRNRQRQVDEVPIFEEMGSDASVSVRRSLEDAGYIDKRGATEAGATTLGFWVTKAGEELAKQICENS